MGILVRVNRDHQRHRWTVHSLTHGTRFGHAEGLLLRAVTFRVEGPSGWAEGELVSWNDMQVDPKFAARVEARLLSLVEAKFWGLKFDGQFRTALDARPLVAVEWLRTLGAEAEVSGLSY